MTEALVFFLGVFIGIAVAAYIVLRSVRAMVEIFLDKEINFWERFKDVLLKIKAETHE